MRGWLAALGTKDGKVLWQAYHTGPDKDVLIGDRFKPFYAGDRGKDLGVTTWPPDAWRIGGRNGMGIPGLRSGQQSDLLRDCQSRAVEPGSSARH